MSDENKKNAPFDPYKFSEIDSEIERIQMEIERDLTYNTETNTETNMKTVSEPAPVPPMSLPVVVPAPESFYTETIKQEAAPAFMEQVRQHRRLIITLLIICTLGTGTLGLGVGFGIVYLQRRAGISEQASGNNPQDDTAAQAVGSSRLVFGNDGTTPMQEGSLADVVRLVDPAVVRVTPTFQNQPPRPFITGDGVRSSDGSGIIFAMDEERVFIVTNNHVTLGADMVHITMKDADPPIRARLVGNNQAADLVVLSVYVSDVQRAGIREVVIADFGDSDAMQVGDVVLAIGNAMGEGNSTTSGIISAGEKEITVSNRTFRVLQTDAAINPGNSGGPLVNKQGQVVGINTLAGSHEHYAIEGMGFSIPSNVAKPVIEAIMNRGRSAFFGIMPADVSERIANELRIPPIGVYVGGVVEDTGAYRAGVARGDVITSFNGRAIFNVQQLLEEIAQAYIGDTVEVMIIRGGRHLVLEVTLGENNIDNF